MSTTQPATVATGGLTPNGLTELLVNNMILSKLTTVMDTTFTMSFENIMKVIILLSINEIKNGTNTLFRYMIDQIKAMPSLGITFATTSVQYLKYRRGKQIVMDMPTNKQSIIKIGVEKNFMDCLYNYIVKNVDGNCRYSKTIEGVMIKNIKERVYHEVFLDLEVDVDNATIRFPGRIEFHTNRQSKMLEDYRMPNKFSCYSDMLPKEIKEFIVKIYNIIITEGDDVLLKTYGFEPYINKSDRFTECTVAKLISDKYGFDYKKTILEVSILATLLYAYANAVHRNIITNDYNEFVKNETTYTFLYDIGPKYVCDVKQIKGPINISIQSGFYNKIVSETAPTIGLTATQPIQMLFMNFGKSSNVPEAQKQNVEITISSPHQHDPFELTDKFIDVVTSLTKKTTKKIDIYSIAIKINVTKSIVDNPEYIEWQQRMNPPKKTKGKGNRQDAVEKSPEMPKLDFMPMMMDQPPPRKVTDEKVTKELLATKLNSIEKSIDTLYLRSRDINKLLTCLHQFRDKKELMESLGFQNKLNILLYGMPGTGKSTTITAIATYMQRDIYYVDLKEAKTNKDLQMIFEYVNKNVKGGGIVVFEDIDSMTNVVLKRRNPKDMTVSELAAIGDSELTLEYLLNILQGTLTIDDSIIIVTTNHIDHLDPAFYRDGRFDVKIELKLCDRFQIDAITQRILGRKLSNEILQKIPEDKYSPATIIFHVKDYIFNPDATDEEIMERFITGN
jgi:nucleoside-triphosphatase THEP1